MVNALEVLAARDAAKSGRARRIRIAAGLNQSDVGRHIGVSPATVSRWENGVRAPTGAAAERLALLLRELTAYVVDGGDG